jgi:hypothetical protein
MKRLMKTTVRGAALAALLVLTFTPLLASGGEKIERANCATGAIFPRMNTFMQGGTMQEFSAFVAPSLRGPGQGVWNHYPTDISLMLFNSSALTPTALLRDGLEKGGMLCWTFQEALIKLRARVKSSMPTATCSLAPAPPKPQHARFDYVAPEPLEELLD